MKTRTLSLAAALWMIAAGIAAGGDKPSLPSGSGRGAGPRATATKPNPPSQRDPKSTAQPHKDLPQDKQNAARKQHELQKHQHSGQGPPSKHDLKPPMVNKSHPGPNKPAAGPSKSPQLTRKPGGNAPGGPRPAMGSVAGKAR